MDRVRRLYGRVKKTKNNCSFEDINALLQALEFTVRQSRRGGSHYTYKRDSITITVPRAKPVKRAYVTDVLQLVAPLLSHQTSNGDSEEQL